jgi:LPS sulfotransferase NodH
MRNKQKASHVSPLSDIMRQMTIRFIVLAHHRSGSTLLVDALQQHPRVRMHGEILTTTEDEAARRASHAVAGRWLADGDDGAAFLRHVFIPQGDESAVGFKLMQNHARRPPHLSAWDHVCGDRELRVIHLWREDLLACALSHFTAARTRIWHVADGEGLPPEPEPFAVSVEHCRAEFTRLEQARARARALFSSHAFLELEYRRHLDGDFGVTMARVFEFLDVPAVTVRQRLCKMARRSPREQFVNYAELARAFAGSPYARFFA